MTQFLLLLLIIPTCIIAKVYDCFPFFNEIELLKMRLEELDSAVDYFVLVESIETQRGDLKPLYFNDNKHLFEKYLPKIIHIIVDERHPEMGLWEREGYQRECLKRGLTGCDPYDIIILSDLDELPRTSSIKKLKKLLTIPNEYDGRERKRLEKEFSSIYHGYSLQMDVYYFQLNRQTPDGKCWGGGTWYGTVATNYLNVAKMGPQYYREQRNNLPRIDKGGWHFTWMGGRDRIRQKLSSVVEGREDGYMMSDEEVDRMTSNHPARPVDSSFPSYMRRNEAYLRSIGFIGED